MLLKLLVENVSCSIKYYLETMKETHDSGNPILYHQKQKVIEVSRPKSAHIVSICPCVRPSELKPILLRICSLIFFKKNDTKILNQY